MKKYLSLIVSLVLLAALLAGCGGSVNQASASYDRGMGDSSTTEMSTAAAEAPMAALAENAPERLTMEQLEQLREAGKVEYILSDQGYVTWLRGDFYDGKVEGEEGVLGAVERTRNLLGLDEEAQFVKGVAWHLNSGYTYFTIRQFSGGTSVTNSIIKVIADGDGNAVAIASSVTPGLGSETKEPFSGKAYWPGGNGTFLSQYPAGEYLVLVRAFDGDGVPRGIIYTNSGWVITEDIGLAATTTADISAAVPVAIQAGVTTTLEPMAF